MLYSNFIFQKVFCFVEQNICNTQSKTLRLVKERQKEEEESRKKTRRIQRSGKFNWKEVQEREDEEKGTELREKKNYEEEEDKKKTVQRPRHIAYADVYVLNVLTGPTR